MDLGEQSMRLLPGFMEVMAALFVLAIGVLAVVVAVMRMVDVRQTRHAIRHNYSVIGRFRYWFEHLGGSFRQCLFALDCEEMPFNRAQRSRVYGAAKEVNVSQLLDSVGRVRDVSGKPTGFKAVIGAFGWLDDLFAELHRRGLASAPDFITADGGNGGTGAAPMSLMDDVGLPLTESLPLLVDELDGWGLRERVRV